MEKMICLTSTWWIKQGNEKIVEPALQKLASDVQNNEPGTLMYSVHTPNFDTPSPSVPVPRPGEIVFVESYRDWDAFEMHVNGSHFKAFKENFGKYFVQSADENGKSGPYVDVKFINRIAGFDRSY